LSGEVDAIERFLRKGDAKLEDGEKFRFVDLLPFLKRLLFVVIRKELPFVVLIDDF
jgi:hypothetical protein